MGRSVSVPSNAAFAGYKDCSGFGLDGDSEYDDVLDEMDYTDFIDALVYFCSGNWPSLQPVSKWVGNEERVLLENNFAQIGVSRYGDIIAIWGIPTGEYKKALAGRWLLSIAPVLLAEFCDLKKLGNFSTGGGVYERVQGTDTSAG